MPMKLSINIGFVTNSSFAVHHFPRQLLDHPEVSAFIEAYEIAQGFIGSSLWHRSACSTVAMTQEQKKQVVEAFQTEEEYFRPPGINTESDEVVVIYGDEHESVARSLSRLMRAAADEMGLKYASGEYH